MLYNDLEIIKTFINSGKCACNDHVACSTAFSHLEQLVAHGEWLNSYLSAIGPEARALQESSESWVRLVGENIERMANTALFGRILNHVDYPEVESK